MVTNSLNTSRDSAGNRNSGDFVTKHGTQDGTYSLTNMYATVPILSFSSGVYDGMVEAMIQKQGFLEIPYKNYTMFQDTGNSIRWHASSASIDRLWQCTRATNYQTEKVPILVEGYNSVYDNVFDYANDKYVHSYYNMPEPASWLQSTVVDQFVVTTPVPDVCFR